MILGALACSAGGHGGSGASPAPGGPRLPASRGSGAGNDLLAGEGSTSAEFPDLGASSDGPGRAGNSYTDDAHTQPARRVDCADSAQLAAFRAASPGSSLRLSYPYDGTVWPRGLLPPVLQWDGAGGDAIYLKMQSRGYAFEGCFAGAGAPARFSIPQDAWIGAGEWSLGAADPTSVTLAVRTGASISATSQQWSFALADIKGAIYYNTYGSPKALRQTPPAAGAVLKILPAQAEPQVFLSIPGVGGLGPCVSCHSLSSDGSTMTAIDIAAPPGIDPSHPAFFLPGQELGSGNVRAFAALEPCKDDGSGCASGTDCCSGFCTDNVCGPPRECSGIDERCVTSDACCNPNPNIQCIAGFCATVQIIR